MFSREILAPGTVTSQPGPDKLSDKPPPPPLPQSPPPPPQSPPPTGSGKGPVTPPPPTPSSTPPPLPPNHTSSVPPSNFARPSTTPKTNEIVLPPFQKGWCKGSRHVFLTARLADYKTSLQQSKLKGTDFLDATFRAYDSIYPWYLGIDEEPLPPQLPMPLPVPLTPEEEAMKAACDKRIRHVSQRHDSSHPHLTDSLLL